MALSNEGRLLATSGLSPNESVCLWNADSGELIHRLRGHGRLGGKPALAFFPDGKRLASWGDDMYLRVWDTATGQMLTEHAIRPGDVQLPENEDGSADYGEDWSDDLGRATFSENAEMLFLMFGSTGYVFDTDTGRESANFTDESARRVGWNIALSPDGSLLANTASIRIGIGQRANRYEVCVRRLTDNEIQQRFVLPGRGEGPVAWSHNGEFLATAPRFSNGPIHIHSVESGELVAEIKDVAGMPRGLAFSHDDSRLASSLTDTTVIVWGWREFAVD
jgi:WD40 repeat protein